MISEFPVPKKFLMREDFNQEPLIPIEETSMALVNLTDASATWDNEAKDNKGVSYYILWDPNHTQKIKKNCIFIWTKFLVIYSMYAKVLKAHITSAIETMKRENIAVLNKYNILEW